MPVRLGKPFGVTGNVGKWGISDTGEYLSHLKGQSAILTYDEMRRSDSQVKACIRAITLPIIKNNYSVAPGDDKPDSVEIADFIEKNLLKDMSMTWADTLRHAMLHKTFGYIILEKEYVYDKEAGKIKIKKLSPRMPQSITKWNYDEDSLKTVEQQDTDGKTYTIPIENLLVFTNDKEGANWEGISDLRSVYGNWWIKKDLMKIDAIRHERWGVGVPIGTAPENIDSEDKAWGELETALAALYAQEQGYIIKPQGWELDILNGSGTGTVDIVSSIRYHDEAIALGFLAQFLKLGQTQSGSRALGESFIDFFLMNLQDAADYICQVINRFCIKELVDMNWSGVKEYPQLVPEEIREIDPQVVSTLVSTGVITKDMQVENSMRRRLNLPEWEDEEAWEEKHKAPTINIEPDTEDEEDDGEGDAAANSKIKRDEKKKEDNQKEEKMGAKVATPEELLVDLPGIEYELSIRTASLTESLTVIRDKQVERIAEKLVEGRKIYQISVPYKAEMLEEALRHIPEQVASGYRQVKREVGKQKTMFSEEDDSLLQKISAYVKEQVEVQIEAFSNALLGAMSMFDVRLRRNPIRREELKSKLVEKFSTAMFGAPVKGMAATVVNLSWAEGRAAALKEESDNVAYYYRSAILDKSLCDVCRRKNGESFTPESDSVDMTVPDPECLGREACRCMIIAVMKSEGQ